MSEHQALAADAARRDRDAARLKRNVRPRRASVMSVRARVEDAQLLWTNGRREGAFLTALIAVAATSRKRFPDRKSVTDREAFERFLEAAHSVRLSVEYRGECHPIEHVFYKWFRCELVHEEVFRA